ncbi:DUF4267 domain-containing protein [Bradyrhizobium sp. HKCCYLS2033]|uniref:DUF4267 domain-containing protein n=1 Tax=unclassified Bradyrhizobium TaxID=2631580 RepID=UPI003EBA0452
MHWVSLGLALLLAVAIIAIGLQYVSRPLTAMRSFGLPPPESGPDVAAWLRLKGVRDIASGLTVLAMMMCGSSGAVGLVLLAEAVIPLGDMLIILAANGSKTSAFGMHGLTAAIMVLAAVPLLIGVA